jgi:hypothetical protein
MARPKKMGADELLRIVDSYYESCGDVSRLKCSFLEEYAIAQGVDVKAYDFRRCPEVRKRMEELRAWALLRPNGGAAAYKNLDVDALLKRCRTRNALKNALLDLDSTWHRIYDQMVTLSRAKDALTSDIQAKTAECEKFAAESACSSALIAELKKNHKAVLLENRYLKKMLRQYLYPAIANEILIGEKVLEQADTEVPPQAITDMVDPGVPSTFSQSVSADMTLISRESSLLRRMKDHIKVGNTDA